MIRLPHSSRNSLKQHSQTRSGQSRSSSRYHADCLQLDDAVWDYGAPLADIKRLANYWEKSFDWRAQEQSLNELPNFHRAIKVDGFPELDIHYLHQPSSSADAVPLLFCHGWPGSYVEVTKMLEALKQSNQGVSFHVVAPSLPNFGW